MKIVKFGFEKNPILFLADYIIKNAFEPFKTILIVPNQRFRNYFSKVLLSLKARDVFPAPTIITPLQMITELSVMPGNIIASPYRCYSVFRKAVEKTNGIDLLFNPDYMDSFQDFVEICEGYLGIFREINEQRVDIFSMKSTDLWGFDHEELAGQFEIFKKLYKNYLDEQGEALDPGFAINFIEEIHVKKYFEDYENIILVNPVALTRFEKWVYTLIDQKLHVLYQETPSFDFSRILAYRELASSPISIPECEVFFSEEPTKTKQALAIIDVIYKLLESGKKPDDILILNLDSQFTELLYLYLKESGIEINFSEGLPLRDTPLYGFFSLIKRFYELSFDKRVFTQFLKNDIAREIIEKTISNEKLHVLSSRIDNDINQNGSEFSEFFKIIDGLYNSIGFDSLYRSLITVFDFLSKKRTSEFYNYCEVVLDKAYSLRELGSSFKESTFDIFLYILRNERFPLLSESTEGIQLLGLLETRGLSFPFVFVPSFNEGIIPKVVYKLKFFSSTFRKAIGLVSYQERELLQFYHLKRLIDASEKCYLFAIKDKNGHYDTKSRFYYFIEQGIEKIQPLDSEYVIIYPPFLKKKPEKKNYKPRVDLPPGGLNTDQISRYDVQLLNDCRTKYYISKILGVSEEELYIRGLDYSLLGSIVHRIMNLIYRDFKTGSPTEKDATSKLERLVNEHVPEGIFNTGEEIITREVLKKKLGRVIRNDFEKFKDGWSVVVDFLERELFTDISIDGKIYHLKGVLDRVDLSPAGEYHIIDYKTGSIPGKALHQPHRGFKEVQLGFYGLIFKRCYPYFKLGGLYYYDLLGEGSKINVVKPEEIDEYLELFLNHIIDFIKNVESSKYFDLAEDPEKCSYCSFHQICRVLESDLG